MSDRVVVITGGGSGMGQAAAWKFAELGDTVYVLGRREEKLDETARDFDTIHPIVCDVTDMSAVVAAVESIVKNHQTIDVLVNNAGGNLKNKIENPTPEQTLAMWREVLATNLDSAFIVISAFLPHLRNNGSRVVLVGSSAASMGSSQPGVTGLAYAAAKSGITGLMRTLVGSLGARGITINTIAPGPVDHTDFFADGHLPEKLIEIYKSKTPLPQFATVDNVAAAAIFLSSKEAGATTGEILNVSSGLLHSR